jgi:O-antigen/teichoic acid export membrane protein
MHKGQVENLRKVFSSDLARNIYKFLSASVLASACGFIGSTINLRNLTTEEISVLYPIIGVLLISAQFGDLGFTPAIIKNASIHYKNNIERSFQFLNMGFRIKFVLAIVVTIVSVLCAPLISQSIFSHLNYVDEIRLISCAIFFHIILSFIESTLQVESRINTLSAIKIVLPVVKLVGILYFYFSNQLTVLNVLFSIIFSYIIACSIGYMFLNKKIFKFSSTYKNELIPLYDVAKWVTLSAIIVSFTAQCDILMVRSMAGAEELKRLAGAIQLNSVLPIMAMAIYTIVMPKVNAMNGKKELNYFFRKTLLLLPIILVLSIFMYFSSEFLIGVILGDRYLSSVSVFKIYLIGTMITIYVTPISTILYKLNLEKYFIFINLSQVVINILVNYFLIGPYGAEGAAFATVLTRFLALFIVLAFLYKHEIIQYHLKTNRIDQ